MLSQAHCQHFLTLALFIFLVSVQCTAQTLYPASSTGFDHYKAASTVLQDGRILVIGGASSSSPIGSVICEIYDPIKNRYVQTGSLTTPRAWHNAVLLTNGKVLVIGGYTGKTLSTCELYDPTVGTWSPTGSLTISRSRASATLLPNGNVLVAGGYSSQNASTEITSSCEIYDPYIGSWALTSSMHNRRSSHAAAMLSTGKVLVVSGYPYSPSCELYDPVVKEWTETSPLPGLGMGEHTLTILTSGKVLATGGWAGSGGMLSRCEIYDPQTETWRLTSPMGTSRASHRSILLPDGRVFIIGGHNARTAGQDNTCYSIATTEFFDPRSEQWSQGPALPFETSYFIAALLPSGFVWVGAGGKRDINKDPAFYHRQSLLVDFTSGSFSSTKSTSTGHTAPSATLIPNGQVVLLGGQSNCEENAPNSGIELYDYLNENWTSMPASTTSSYGQTATLIQNGLILIVGGRFNNEPTSNSWIYDASTNQLYSGPHLKTARCNHTATLMMDGSLLIVGGETKVGTTSNVEIFDSETQTWAEASPLPLPLEGHTATLLPDGNVLIAGGSNGTEVSKECFLYNPTCDVWQTTGNLQLPRSHHTATLLQNGEVLISGGALGNGTCEIYTPSSSSWIATGAVGIPRMNHSATLLSNGNVVVIGGTAANGTSSSVAETYNPIDRSWRTTGLLPQGRANHAALLLPTGKILIAGGLTQTNAGCIAPSESYIFDPAFGYQDSERPNIASIDPVYLSAAGSMDAIITLQGSGFRDNNRSQSEGSTGDYNNTPTNYPVVEIQRIGGDRFGTDFSTYLPFNINHANWSSSETQIRLALGTSNHRALPTGYYALTVIASGVPSISKYFQISYSDNPSHTSFTQSPPTINCSNYSFDISNSCAIYSIILDSSISRNVTMFFYPPLPAPLSHVTLQLIDPNKDGIFTLRVNNNRIIHDTIQPSTKFNLAGTSLGTPPISLANGCDSIIIHNTDKSIPLILNTIYLRHNTTFSIPPSQLPLTIPPNSSKALRICVAQNSSEIRNDTLVISDECEEISVPLTSLPLPIWSGEGTNCQTLLNFRQASNQKIIVKNPPRVDATLSLITIPIEYYTPNGTEPSAVKCSLYNIAGNSVRDGECLMHSIDINSRYAIQRSVIQISTHGCPSGFYVIMISSPDEILSYPIIISR